VDWRCVDAVWSDLWRFEDEGKASPMMRMATEVAIEGVLA